MQVISLVGFQGSGKDTAAEILINQGFVPFSFAESLKDTLATIFCWEREMLEGKTLTSRAWRETIDPWWAKELGIANFTPRFAMQHIGTDLFRRHFSDRVWIMNIKRKLSALPKNAKVVIVDGRFPNELDLGREFGAVVTRIKRGDEPLWYNTALTANGFGRGDRDAARAMLRDVFMVHESEWAWIGQPIDVTIENDASIEELHTRVIALAA